MGQYLDLDGLTHFKDKLDKLTVELTQSEYNQLGPEKLTNGVTYYITDMKSAEGVGIATTQTAGIIKPDGTTITIDEDGTIHSIDAEGKVASQEITEIKLVDTLPADAGSHSTTLYVITE